MRWTLYRKIQILIIGILLFNFLAVEVTLFNYIGQGLTERYIENIEVTSELLTKNIDQIFHDANQMLNFLAMDLTDHSVEDKQIYKHLKDAQLTHGETENIFLAYEDMSFLIYPEATIEDGFDPRNRLWYKKAATSNEVEWSSPYVDVVSKDLVITGSKYVEMADINGVVGMDITLEAFSEMINQIDISENGWMGVLNSNNEFVGSTNHNYINKQFKAIQDPEITGLDPIYGRFTTNKGLYIIRQINIGNLRMVVFIPNEDANGYRTQASGIMTIVTTAILLVGIIASRYMTKKVTTPLVKLRNALVESTYEQDMVTLEEVSDDEINILVKEYNNLAIHINEQREKIGELAFTDELTGLANRYQFVLEVRRQIENNDQVALFYLDLDNFKYINDTYGHAAGDLVLSELGKRLTRECDENSIIARLSGDEFGLSIYGNKSEGDIRAIAMKVLTIVSKPISVNQFVFALTASLGISRYPQDAMNYAELLTNADVAMYSAKGDGKDGYMLFNQVIHDSFIEEMNIETRLGDAIIKGEIYPVFQPLVELKTGQIVGFEALARWTDKEHGPVNPEVFIPIAERNLSIIPMGWHIFDASVAFGKRLYDIYDKYFEINVNVSVIQLKAEGYVEGVMEILEKYNYPAMYLNLEITESLTLESSEHLMMKLAYLRKKDIRISLDDFGTGYSSLGHLTDLSLSHIKIDRQLIVKAKQSQEVFQLMKGIVKFAHIMGYEVVAEGVEDKGMEQLVLEMEADYGQGYMYARPMTEEDIHILLGI